VGVDILPTFSIQKLFTIDNIRMINGKWFVDKTVFTNSGKHKIEICIGKNLSWQKLSEKVPEAIFKRIATNSSIRKLIGITFAKIDIKTVDDKAYSIPLYDENGYWLLSIDTGNSLADDLSQAIKSKKST
jgi:hypothetical protein